MKGRSLLLAGILLLAGAPPCFAGAAQPAPPAPAQGQAAPKAPASQQQSG